jgi:hypothetical protein
VGWLLREAGTTDPRRFERFLRAAGYPHLAHRYAIERLPPMKRKRRLVATR